MDIKPKQRGDGVRKITPVLSLVLLPSGSSKKWVLVSHFCKSSSSSAKWKKLKKEKSNPNPQERIPTSGIIINVKLFSSVMGAMSSYRIRVAGRSLSWAQCICINK